MVEGIASCNTAWAAGISKWPTLSPAGQDKQGPAQQITKPI